MSTALKKHINVSLNDFVAQKLAAFGNQAGQAWPCHVTAVNGAVVTIAFDVDSGAYTLPQVTVPVVESRYVRLPVQVGDRGVAISASVSIGNVSGLGPPAPVSLTAPGNLSALMFMPIGNAAWATPDANAVVVTAPDGAIIQDDAGTTKVVLTGAGNVTVQCPGTVTLEAANINIVGTLTINGTPFLDHVHTLVQTGTSDSGPVGP